MPLTEDATTLTLNVDWSDGLGSLTDQVISTCREAERLESSILVVQVGATPADEHWWARGLTTRDVTRWEKAVRRLERVPAAVVGSFEGRCDGVVLDLLLTADYRIGARDLVLTLPRYEGNFWPGMALYRLTQQLGAARTRQLVLWGKDLTADQAVELCLLDEVAAEPHRSLDSACALLGRARGPELAIRRQLILETASAPYEDALGVHLAACDRELRRLSTSELLQWAAHPASAVLPGKSAP
jgi:isomerase DpgB